MLRIISIFASFLLVAECYKILVVNTKFGHSHSTFMGGIADILAEEGHNVTSLIPIIDPRSTDGTLKSSKIYVDQSAATAELMKQFASATTDLFNINKYSFSDAYYLGKFFASVYATQCRAVLEEPGLINILRDEKYDVMFSEHYDLCGTALSHFIKPKSFISTSSSVAFGPQLDEFGIPRAVSYNPELSMPGMNVHSMWDRLENIYVSFLLQMSFGYARTEMDSLFREKYGASFPTVLEISSNSAYVFVNSEPLIDFATPTISKVIYIGGVGAKEPKKLDESWETILDKREKTVLLSFGSVTKSVNMPIGIKMSIIETIKSLPYTTFIWKYEENDEFSRNVASKIDNLEIVKWMPQVDLLAHPSLSAFITHGGMGSVLEMSRAGVPGIFVPLFGDQPRNGGMMEHNGLGRVMNKNDLHNPVKFAALIEEVVGNDRYRASAQRISAMLRKKPFAARELIIKYTEFAAEFGPSKALRPQSYDMNWIEYHNVDILLIVFSLALALSGIAITALRTALSWMMRSRKIKRE